MCNICIPAWQRNYLFHGVDQSVNIGIIPFGQCVVVNIKIFSILFSIFFAKVIWEQRFDNVTERELHQFINVLARCRNVCAHGERLFSFKINETIPDTLLHKKLKIQVVNNHYVCGKQDLFAVVIALRYLISNDEFKHFKATLSIYKSMNCWYKHRLNYIFLYRLIFSQLAGKPILSRSCSSVRWGHCLSTDFISFESVALKCLNSSLLIK